MVLTARGVQTLAHELALGETHPPLQAMATQSAEEATITSR